MVNFKEWFEYDENIESCLKRIKTVYRYKSGQERVVTKDDPCSGVDGGGYYVTSLKQIPYKVHRIVYALHHFDGDITKLDGFLVDHINCDRKDNRICNLRLVNYNQNSMNRSVGTNNTSGVKGVGWRKDKGCWRAQLKINGKTLSFGQYATRDEAEAAIKIARDKYHKEFANDG